jgi:hypothetical protein
VDEAIAALHTGGPLTLRPVPRLEDALVALGKWSPPPAWLRPVGGWLDVIRAADDGGFGRGDGPGRAVGGSLEPVVVVVPRPAGRAPEAPAAPQPAAPVAPVAGGDDDDEEDGNAGSPGNPVATATAPYVEVPPTPPPPTAVSPPATPTATTVPVNQPPVIEVAWCSPNPVMVFGVSNCAVLVTDEDNASLTYSWSADLGQMLGANTANATYYADFDHGVKETATWIAVRVTDNEGLEDEYRFLMKVNSLPQGGNGAAPRGATGP